MRRMNNTVRHRNHLTNTKTTLRRRNTVRIKTSSTILLNLGNNRSVNRLTNTT